MDASMGGGGNFQSEINVTPLVDVVLVLLIIFMVIVPLTVRGYDVDIPGESVVSTPPDKVDDEQTVLAIDLAACPVVEPPEGEGLPADCRVRINDEQLAVTELSDRIGQIFAARAADDRLLFLTAHDRLNYEAVMRIVDVAKSGVAGLRIGLVTERKRG